MSDTTASPPQDDVSEHIAASSPNGITPRSEVLQFMGVQILHPDPDDPTTCVCECELTDAVRNTAGVMNGGVVATVIDTAAGSAAARATQSVRISTATMNLQYLTPVSVGPGRATARVLRRGSRSVAIHVEMVDAGDGDRLAAVALMNLTAGPPSTDGLA